LGVVIKSAPVANIFRIVPITLNPKKGVTPPLPALAATERDRTNETITVLKL